MCWDTSCAGMRHPLGCALRILPFFPHCRDQVPDKMWLHRGRMCSASQLERKCTSEAGGTEVTYLPQKPRGNWKWDQARHHSRLGLRDSLPPVRLSLLEIPQPSQTAPPAGTKPSSRPSRDTSHSNHSRYPVCFWDSCENEARWTLYT